MPPMPEEKEDEAVEPNHCIKDELSNIIELSKEYIKSNTLEIQPSKFSPQNEREKSKKSFIMNSFCNLNDSILNDVRPIPTN